MDLFEIAKRVTHKRNHKITNCKHKCIACRYYKDCKEDTTNGIKRKAKAKNKIKSKRI